MTPRNLPRCMNKAGKEFRQVFAVCMDTSFSGSLVEFNDVRLNFR
jgi:hypothetical protein